MVYSFFKDLRASIFHIQIKNGRVSHRAALIKIMRGISLGRGQEDGENRFSAIAGALLVVLAVLFLVPQPAAAVVREDPLLSCRNGLAAMRTDFERRPAAPTAIAALIRSADRVLSQTPPSVVEKRTFPPGGDAHDYASLAIYYWPDPEKPDGRPYRNRDGEINPERASPERYDAARMTRMVGSVETLGLARVLTGREIYAAKAAAFVRTWFLDPATRMRPHLNFAQQVPGKADGNPSGIIETTNLILLTDAARLLEGSAAWTDEIRSGLKGWFLDYCDWLMTSPAGRAESRATNNHGIWYDAQLATFAAYAGREETALRVLREVLPRRISSQIEPDGRMPRELVRTRSLHYSLYNLAALITLARLGENREVDLWQARTAEGRGIRAAIDFVYPYLQQEKEWPYPQIVVEQKPWFARYLAAAERRYRTGRWQKTVQSLLSEVPGRERIAAASLLPDAFPPEEGKEGGKAR
jgi:hypothetical protein